MDNLEELNRKRFLFLYLVYQKTNGNTQAFVNIWEIGQELGFGGFDSEKTIKIVQWLEGEFLIKTKYVGGLIGITHNGIKEVEEAQLKPTNQTEHFYAHSINVVNNGSVTLPAHLKAVTNRLI